MITYTERQYIKSQVLQNELLAKLYNIKPLPFPINMPEDVYWKNRGKQLGCDRQELVEKVMK